MKGVSRYVVVLGLVFCLVFGVTFSKSAEEKIPDEKLADEKLADGSASDEAVITLTGETFDNFVAENEYVLVEFYAPWCGHCKKLAPEYEAAAKHLQEKKSPLKLAKVDSTVETELSTKHSIGGYPTLKLFRHGKAMDYKGGRTKDTIVEWLEKTTGPAIEMVADKTAAEKMAKDEAVAFVGAFSSADSPAYEAYKATAEDQRMFGKYIAYVSTTAKDDLSIYRKEDGGLVGTFPIESKDKLTEILTVERFPYFGPITGDNYADYFGSSLAWFAGTEKEYKAAGPAIREVAKERRGQNNFVWLDVTQFREHAQSALGVKDFPALVLQTQPKEGRYIYPGESHTDAAAMSKFFKDVSAGKVEPFLMSDAVPEKNDEPVKVVVGKTFKEMVLQSDKDVLLEVYAPWCGHCKKFEPIYTEFAEKMAKNKHLVVAKMDGTTNEPPVENFQKEYYPTIFFVKAGNPVPILYDGGRTIEALTEFVKTHSTKPIELEGAPEAAKDEL